MKKGLVYVLGIATGIILTFVVSSIIVQIRGHSGVSYYEEPADVLYFRSVTVFQALPQGNALVKETGHTDIDDQIYLLQLDKKTAFYDGESVKAPLGTVFRVIGVYSYETGGGIGRTVPVITIMER
ncbi:MAG: hypothetical protein IJ653_05935 [Bacteroidales bacterium]|nr:hypothetical protein [Bacteroidales bacterium]